MWEMTRVKCGPTQLFLSAFIWTEGSGGGVAGWLGWSWMSCEAVPPFLWTPKVITTDPVHFPFNCIGIFVVCQSSPTVQWFLKDRNLISRANQCRIVGDQ